LFSGLAERLEHGAGLGGEEASHQWVPWAGLQGVGWQRERLRGFPAEIPSEDLIVYFTLSERDRLLVQGQRGAHNRLGFALQACALRYLGFVPTKLHTARPDPPRNRVNRGS
jgi:Domain of unknown function (DUF4158)